MNWCRVAVKNRHKNLRLLFEFSTVQSALENICILRGAFLVWRVLISQSAAIISWSEILGIVLVDLTKPGLFVQNKSSTLSSLVGSFWHWVRKKSDRKVKRVSQKEPIVLLGVTWWVCQSMSWALKSPPSIDLARNGNSGCANEILGHAKCHFWWKSPWKWKN